MIAFGLSMDCFAVAVSFSMAKKIHRDDVIRMAVFFGFFQGAMPLVGWLVGGLVQKGFASFDHWIAFGVLSVIGIKMIIQSFHEDHSKKTVYIGKLSVLISLSVATSIDAFVTGISFGFIRVNIISASVIITVVTFFMTLAGSVLGKRTRFIPSRLAEITGGVVLIAIGLKVLGDHMGFWG